MEVLIACLLVVIALGTSASAGNVKQAVGGSSYGPSAPVGLVAGVPASGGLAGPPVAAQSISAPSGPPAAAPFFAPSGPPAAVPFFAPAGPPVAAQSFALAGPPAAVQFFAPSGPPAASHMASGSAFASGSFNKPATGGHTGICPTPFTAGGCSDNCQGSFQCCRIGNSFFCVKPQPAGSACPQTVSCRADTDCAKLSERCCPTGSNDTVCVPGILVV